ncbi:hypothetical protein B9Z65_2817 [Elsinoe australis]|uniref:DNA polymerase lambda n=1 Tax=Elsinoe australis TaxID=40998 RepID=A0A2P8A4R5_9PEZI|nr:hypothetical protein B9Z65_2817 [Elsinoe australis]
MTANESSNAQSQCRYQQKLADFAFFDLADDSDERDPGMLESMATLKRKRESGSSIARASTPDSSAISQRQLRSVTRISDKVQALNRSTSAPSGPDQAQQTDISTVASLQKRSVSSLGTAIGTGPATSSKIPSTNPSGKVFEGCYFYFFPNNENHPGRRFRMQKAVEHGAGREVKWSAAVTHLIVDRSMNYEQVCGFLSATEKLEQIPAHVHVVNENYPADCISYRSLVDPQQKQYEVRGFEPQRHDPELPRQKAAAAPSSSELKPAGKAVQSRHPQTPSQNTVATTITDPSPQQRSSPPWLRPPPPVPEQDNGAIIAKETFTEQDELGRAIEEAKQAQGLLLDEDDAESRPGSSGSESDRASKKTDVPKWQEKFQCMQKNTVNAKDGPNATTIAILQEMSEHYVKMQDTWRPIAYRKAINTLRNHPVKVCTAEEAEKLPFIGGRLALKVEEIVYTNHLRRLESAKAEPTDKVLQIFLGVYGIGFNAGMKFVAQGYKTLSELREHAKLNDNQRIGIDHYEDFNSRISRAEVKQHSDVVRSAAHKLDPAIEIYTMGSYRRGAQSSNDIDLIITHPHWTVSQLRSLLVDRLIPCLFKQDFLQCSLASISKVDGTKWHGASRLPGSKVWRRIDFLLVPMTELGAALIYFTGNDIFNRSMRLLASRKGMRLNQRGLYRNVMRGKGREKVTEGELVEGRDEKRIFEVLGVPWREPEERIC